MAAAEARPSSLEDGLPTSFTSSPSNEAEAAAAAAAAALPTFTSSPDAAIPLRLDMNALYIVLTTTTVQSASNTIWQWALYLHIRDGHGWVFYIAHRELGAWTYRTYESTDMMYSQTALAVVKIADMAPDLHEALRERIGTGSQPAVKLQDSDYFGRLNCQAWLLQVLYELDNEGYISVSPGYSIKDLEQEALALASNNNYLIKENKVKLRDVRREIDSAFCVF